MVIDIDSFKENCYIVDFFEFSLVKLISFNILLSY